LVDIDYEPLLAISDCRAALAPGAPKAHRASPHNLLAEFDMAYGDVDAAFSKTAHVFRESLWQHRGGGHSIECRGAVALHDTMEDRLTLWSSTQMPHAAMRLLCDMLGRDENQVRVITPDVGGGFGPKLVFYPEDVVTSLAAILLKRPVKWIEDRLEHFVATTPEREQYWDDRVARELKLDRAEVRRRNLVPAEKMPYKTKLKARGGLTIELDSGDYPKCQHEALARAGWDDFPRRQALARKEGRSIGIGVANFVKGTGRGPFESVTVRISPSGKVHVYSGAAAMGQSTKTMLAQVVAEQLGADLSNIAVTTGDTGTISMGLGGSNSRQTVMAGTSAHV